MIVAIINQTNPVGKIPVQEFREAIDENTAVDDFCIKPPANPLDYLGFDTGWSSIQRTDPGKFWAYDFSSPGLIQESDIASVFCSVWCISPTTVALINPVGWDSLGGQVSSPDYWGNPALMIQQVEGVYRATGTGAKLRIEENGIPISVDCDLAASAWIRFIFQSKPLITAGRNTYTISGTLGLASLAEVKYLSITLLMQ